MKLIGEGTIRDLNHDNEYMEALSLIRDTRNSTRLKLQYVVMHGTTYTFKSKEGIANVFYYSPRVSSANLLHFPSREARVTIDSQDNPAPIGDLSTLSVFRVALGQEALLMDQAAFLQDSTFKAYRASLDHTVLHLPMAFTPSTVEIHYLEELL